MFSQSILENILFLDIETVCMAQNYEQLPAHMQRLWDKKAARYQKNETDKTAAELFFEKAGIHAEFGKIVCISCGYLTFENYVPSIKLKSFCGANEVDLLKSFGEMLDKYMAKGNRNLCAHNGKEFDFPYLGRRFIINQLPIPESLQIQGKKPWEVNFIDTMELWKFGDYKAYTSLELLATIFGIESPKDDIDGSQVAHVFWRERAYDRIQKYCEKDVKTTAQVLLRMSLLPLIP